MSAKTVVSAVWISSDEEAIAVRNPEMERDHWLKCAAEAEQNGEGNEAIEFYLGHAEQAERRIHVHA